MRQKLSKKPISAVTSLLITWALVEKAKKSFTRLIICRSFITTSREGFDSRTSRIARSPWDETNCICISGASAMIAICQYGKKVIRAARNKRTSWSQVSLRVKSGDLSCKSSICWLTATQSLAYLSRFKFVSRSSSVNPSSKSANGSSSLSLSSPG